MYVIKDGLGFIIGGIECQILSLTLAVQHNRGSLSLLALTFYILEAAGQVIAQQMCRNRNGEIQIFFFFLMDFAGQGEVAAFKGLPCLWRGQHLQCLTCFFFFLFFLVSVI